MSVPSGEARIACCHLGNTRELLGVIFCVRFRDVANNCSVTDLGATEAIPYSCRAGGCRKHCGMFCGFPAGADAFPPCAQHALNKVTEGN